MVRSPKGSGYPLITFKVISVDEPSFTINPILYTLFADGDFDGDTVGVFRNEGLMETRHSFIYMISVLYEDNSKERKMMQNTFKAACDASDLPIPKDVENLHPVIGSMIQMTVAKRLTGAYDRLASRCQKMRLSTKWLRVLWNEVVQKTITNMKHIGNKLALRSELESSISRLFEKQ
jgi:hypothetical protein